MINSKLKQEKKKKYKSVNSEDRQKIINYFIQSSLSATQIAQITGHNLSTIKAIFRIYRNEGRIKKKEKRDRELHIQKNVAIFVVDDTTRYLNLILKQHIKKEVIQRGDEKCQECQYDIIKETLQKSSNEVRNNMNSYQSKGHFDLALKKILMDGIKEDDFINIYSNTNFQANTYSNIRGSAISNLFKNNEEKHSKGVDQMTQQEICLQQEQELTDLKRVFEQQVEEFLGKSYYDKLK